MGQHQICRAAVRTPLRHALLVTTALCSASAFALISPERALAQSSGGNGGSSTFANTGFGGSYEQNGGNGASGTTSGGGGGGPGAAGTLGGLPGNNDAGGGGAGGVNGVTAAAVPAGSHNGGNGGNATPAVNAVTIAGGGGGAGGYGVALTTAGPHTTTAGQVFTGGNGGNANGRDLPGNGGLGGGGLLLKVGGTFTNVVGASLVGGAGGSTPSVSANFFFNNGGDGLTTSNYVGTPFAATVNNAGTITGGAGGVLAATPGAPVGATLNFSGIGGAGVHFLGGSFTNNATGVITGGIGGAGFGGTATLGAGVSGFGGVGLAASGGGLVTNDGRIIGGAGPGGTAQAVGSRPGSELSNGFNSFAGGAGGTGAVNDGTASAPGAIVNNATGVIRGGRGGDGTNGIVNPASPHVAAGAGGGGGLGVSITSGSILNFGQILGGAAGAGANAVAGQVGGSDFSNSGGTGVELRGIFFQSSTMSLDNRALIAGGTGSTPGTSGPGAAGAKGGDGGIGVDARKPVTGTLTILNSGQITGGNGAAGSAGTPNGANGLGGVGMQMLGDGTITSSGAISGGLNGDGVTRARAITFLSGVHTLTLQTGATFAGNVVVDTAAAFNPGVSANNTLNLDSAGTNTISLAQFVNFGHLTQTGAGGGIWTLTGSGAFTNDATLSSGTMSLAAGAVLTVPSMTVTGSGLLGGTGTVAGTLNVNNGGVLSPGNSIGVINVNGNLVLGAGAIYRVEVAPANGSADRTNVTGSAGLGGGTLNAVATGGTYTPGSRYTVLHADGGLNGQFAGVTFAPGSFGTFRPIAIYDTANNNVDLLIAQGLVTPFLVNGTPNQRAVAGAVDTALTAGSSLAPLLALFPLASPQLNAALDQLSGEVHVSTAGVLADESRYMRDAVLGRLRQASYGGDAAMASLSVGGPVAAFADGALDSALAYGKSPMVTKAPRMVAPSYDVTFWAQGFGARGRFETEGNAATLRRDLAGFISGVDTRVGGNGRLGIAAGYTGSKNALDGRGSADVETAHIAGYGGWNFGAFNLRAGGAYAFHSIATDRLIAFPGFFDRATANYDGHTGQIFGEVGYGFAFGNVAIEPFAGAAWVRVKTDAAAERGGLAALNVAGTTFETGYATLGIRAASLIPIGYDMVLVPRGTLAWQHAFDAVTPAGVLAFQAAPVPFTITGVPIARDALLAEAGLDLAIGRNATVGVSYVGQLARNVQDHAAKGKFSWKF